MVSRLIIDAVRRKWLIGAFAVFQLQILLQAAGEFWPSVDRRAWIMAGAWFLSMAANDLFSSRVLYQLPVSRRTWWIAKWWIAVVGTVLIAQLASLVAQWRTGSPWMSVEQTLLSMMFGILYCGFSMAVRTTSLAKSADAPLLARFLSVVAFMPMMVLAIAAPFLLSPYLPHSFADLHATGIVVLLVMAGVTILGFRHHPEITARPYLQLARRISSVTPVSSDRSAAPPMAAPPTGFFERLTGAKMMLWEESRKQLITFSMVIMAGIAWWAVGSQYHAWPPLGEVLRRASMLPFSRPGSSPAEPMIFGFLVGVASIADVWMTARIRSLRTLPVSSARLGSLPVVLGLVSASMLWIVLLVLQGLVLRTPPSSLRPDLFTAFAALTAMAHTIRFVAPGQPVLRSMLGLAPIGMFLMTLAYIADSTWRPVPPRSAVLLASLLALAASWAVMRLAVTRSSTMYRPRHAVPTP